MQMACLNQKFGIPHRVHFAEGHGRLVKAVLGHASGARAEIYLHGAHLAAWQPALGGKVIFLSAASQFQNGAPIRGGIPIIFPQFGDGPLPKHGLARLCAWQVARTALGTDGEVTITLRLADNVQTRALWPHRFGLQLTFSLGSALAIEFTAKNTDTSPFCFQAALHTYFQVADIKQTGVLGLQEVLFEEGRNPAPVVEKRAVIMFDRETDRVYINAPDRVVLDDRGNKRQITIRKSGMNAYVVWNPWADKSKKMDDFGDDEYQRMVCIETGNIRAPTVLSPGEQWSGRTMFTCANA